MCIRDSLQGARGRRGGVEAPAERQRLGLRLPAREQLQGSALAQACLLTGALPDPADRPSQG
eukprot:10343315-Alexandrium_andersonii.AAC.1